MQPGAPQPHQSPANVCPARATIGNGVGRVSLLVQEAANYIGGASINRPASNNLVLTDSSSFNALAGGQRRFSHGGLYQGIAQRLIKGVHTQKTLLDFIASVAWAADQALAARKYDRIGALSQLLLSLPLSPQAEAVAHYYEALSINRSGHGDTVRAGALFEQVADRAPLQYRARAMLALGGERVSVGDHRAALPWYGEIMRIATRDRAVDPATLYSVAQMIAVVKARNGDHRGSVADLEEMYPLVRMASYQEPRAYYRHLNSLAVELAEVGRLEEARRASVIACSDPFAPAYPEWQETFDEITRKERRASRSTVAVSEFITEPAEGLHRRRETDTTRRQTGKAHKLFSFPAPQPAASAEPEYARPQRSQARVLDFQQWKRRVESNPGQLSALSPERRMEMTTGEKLIRLMDLISHDDTDDATIDVILEAVEAIVLGSRGAS
jgi:tetratricopeptide (TPR) repeat protein